MNCEFCDSDAVMEIDDPESDPGIWFMCVACGEAFA